MEESPPPCGGEPGGPKQAHSRKKRSARLEARAVKRWEEEESEVQGTTPCGGKTVLDCRLL